MVTIVECIELPDDASTAVVYRLLPRDNNEAYYRERTDRNIGWITREEQEMLRGCTVGIAGCGGMGGMLATIFFRLGVGEVRIADCEAFDISNINRQFGAKRGTVGVSKALQTARDTRAVTDDATLVVYPQGIVEHTAEPFLRGCDIVCDEIEFWAVYARIILHKQARAQGVDILCGDTVGFLSHLFYFTPTSMPVGEMMGLTLDEARILQSQIEHGEASHEELTRVFEAMLRFAIPESIVYSDTLYAGCKHSLRKRMMEEHKAPIIATNPTLSAGFVANRTLLHLLQKKSSIKRDILELPPTPSYVCFDAARAEARIVRRTVMP